MYLLKLLILFIFFNTLNIHIASSQSIELRNSLKATKTLYNEGKLLEAITSATKAIEFSKIDFGMKHYYTATLIENLGIIQYELFMYEEARNSFIEVLSIRKETLKEDHTDIAESLNYIALSNRKLLKYEIALNFHNEALLIMSRSITKSNAHAMNEKNRKGAIFRACAMHTKALLEIKNKNINEAIGLLKTSSKIFFNTLGKDKSQLIESYKDLIEQALLINDLELAASTKKKLKKIYKNI